MSRYSQLVAWCAHAFAVRSGDGALAPGDSALLERLAAVIVRRGMVAPAVMLLECARPLGFLGSQFLHFAKPFATLAFNAGEYERLARLLERRECMDLLLAAIAAQEGREHG